MIELAGLILAIVGVVFAFETPRRYFVSLVSRRSTANNVRTAPPIPLIDLCRRGISVREIEPGKLLFDIPYCAGKNANAHNVKLQSAVLRSDGAKIEQLSAFGDDFPDGISLTYETGKSISYTLSPLGAATLPHPYIVVRGSYTAEVGERLFSVFDIFKFSDTAGNWVRTLGDEDKRLRAFVRTLS